MCVLVRLRKPRCHLIVCVVTEWWMQENNATVDR